MLEVKIYGIDGDIIIKNGDDEMVTIKMIDSEGNIIARDSIQYDDLEKAISATK